VARATGLKFGPITPSLNNDRSRRNAFIFLADLSRLREPIRDEVPYTTQALRQDLLRVRIAWDDCQTSRARNAIYGYLIPTR
jgi:hypothetical protein